MPETRMNGILSAERLSEGLAERIAALELRVREQDEAARLSETELHAMERDLLVKEAYLRHLERGQQILAVELAQVRARAAELFCGLEAAEARIVASEAERDRAVAALEAVRASTSYRLGSRLVAAAPRLGPLPGAVRLLARLRRLAR